MLEMFEKKPLDFKTAFAYPFNRATGMLNIFWILLPIIGWFALGGYSVRIIKEFSNGKFQELPEMEFSEDFSLGFFMFLKALPFAIAYGLFMSILDDKGFLVFLVKFLIALFVLPILSINFVNKQTVSSFFEFKILKGVFNNLTDYVIALLKCLGLGIVFCVLSIVLVGIPAGAFTKSIFLADFYRRKI